MKTKFNDFINEKYDRSKDDYRYFRGLISDDVEEKWVESIKSKRSEWVKMMLASARGHWSIGDGDPKKFPKEEFIKVINKVLDDYIDESINEGLKNLFTRNTQNVIEISKDVIDNLLSFKNLTKTLKDFFSFIDSSINEPYFKNDDEEQYRIIQNLTPEEIEKLTGFKFKVLKQNNGYKVCWEWADDNDK